MEKSKVIRCYNEGRHYVETCLEQIASLEQNNDKELRQVLRGTVMVEVSYKAAENFCKVCEYVINGEDGADILKGKLLDLKEKVRQLYDSADKHKLITIREISDSILREIGEVEEWTNDNESDDIQELPQSKIIPETDNVEDEDVEDDDNNYPDFGYELKRVFKTEETFKSFYDKCKDHNPEDIASLYCDQANVLNPKKRGVARVLYDTFVNPDGDESVIVYETFLRYLRQAETE